MPPKKPNILFLYTDAIGKCSLSDSLLEITDAETAQRASIDPVRTVVHPEGWKVTVSPMGFHEVYDLRTDPGETGNVVTEDNGRRWLAQARHVLLQWQMRTGDRAELLPAMPAGTRSSKAGSPR